jgi:hypothetical protein
VKHKEKHNIFMGNRYLWLYPGIPFSFTDKTDRNDIIEILLKVALNTTTLVLTQSVVAKC